MEVAVHHGLGSSLTLSDRRGHSHKVWAVSVRGVRSDRAEDIAAVIEASWP